MQVILLERVRNLGDIGDQVKVKSGYARNFLLPEGKAVPATADNVIKFEQRRAELQQKAAERLAQAQARQVALAAISVAIARRTADEGKLYGSVGTQDLADAITAAGVAVVKSEVLLPEGVIRQLGDYDIQVQLHSDVITLVKVAVVAE